MFRYKEDMWKHGMWYALQTILLPEVYIAVSIQDFLREKKEVVPTSYIQYFARLYFLRDIINYYQKAVIGIPSVTYYRKEGDRGLEITLEDSMSSLTMPAYNPTQHIKLTEKEGLSNGQKAEWALLLYQPKTDETWLFHIFKSLNTPCGESVEYSFAAQLAHAFR